ncbi:hypothetical protein BB559_002527 [Furculomyces boomerangus]|uniref:AB hydrolase-1 domain-containing protein n=1 Tax=Furculomyces boomerangus TaxID=61424 RepID=A0A2T9YUJ6_9FUNG|nr:hypothetical protein BB559_002527 [Furculomyces boomerangus]
MNPKDPSSFNHRFTTVNNNKIHYVDQGNSDKVIVCVHGFPDIWYGWRHQIPFLVGLGYRVIAPDVRGYGQSDSPVVSEKDLASYSTKSLLKDIVGVLDANNIKRAVWLGHDWGGSLVWRAALYHPTYVESVIAVCTPYSPTPPQKVYLKDIVAKHPNWTYQAFFRTPEALEDLNSEKELFLMSILRNHGDMARSSVMSTKIPLKERTIKSVKGIKRSSLISKEELDYYVQQYSIHGFAGPLNQYKTHEINWDEENEAGFVGKVLEIPCLMITVENDPALPAAFTKNMHKYIPNLTKKHIMDAGHWVLSERPNEANKHLKDFLQTIHPQNKL